MTDPSQGLGNGDHPPRRPDPAARRAQLDALRAQSSTSGKGFAASPRRRHHAALASRVLATGLAAGSSVGLIGILARADQVGAQERPTPAVPVAVPAIPVVRGPVLLPNETSTTAPPATSAPTTQPTLPPQETTAPAAPAPGAVVTAPPQTAPPQTAPPQTAPPQTAPPTTRPAPPVTAPPATVPPTTGTGAS